jgi:hypothetical protein
VSKIAVPQTEYSPERRTALSSAGTGADGAYHAGALQAAERSGRPRRYLAGRGIGAVGALFGAIDGGSRLWETTGLWRRPLAAALYPWRRTYRRVAAGRVAGRVAAANSPGDAGLGLMIYELAILVEAAYPGQRIVDHVVVGRVPGPGVCVGRPSHQTAAGRQPPSSRS